MSETRFLEFYNGYAATRTISWSHIYSSAPSCASFKLGRTHTETAPLLALQIIRMRSRSTTCSLSAPTGRGRPPILRVSPLSCSSSVPSACVGEGASREAGLKPAAGEGAWVHVRIHRIHRFDQVASSSVQEQISLGRGAYCHLPAVSASRGSAHLSCKLQATSSTGRGQQHPPRHDPFELPHLLSSCGGSVQTVATVRRRTAKRRAKASAAT